MHLTKIVIKPLAMALIVVSCNKCIASNLKTTKDHSLKTSSISMVYYHLIIDRFDRIPMTACNDKENIREADVFGGNILGIEKNLEYIKSLGADGIILSPFYGGLPDNQFLYHGYSPIDFTSVDPHFGSRDILKHLVERAQSVGLEVIFDFIFNHTADILKYENCENCPFLATGRTFRKESRIIKKPEWMNEESAYNHYGDVDFSKPETYVKGDLYGLDDFDTEKKIVQDGLMQLHQDWLESMHPNGFRIDAAKHIDYNFLSKIIKDLSPKNKIFIEWFDKNENMIFKEQEKNENVIFYNSPLYIDVVNFLLGRNSIIQFFKKVKKNHSNHFRWINFVSSHDEGRLLYWIKQLKSRNAENIFYSMYLFSMILSDKSIIYYGDEQGFLGSGGVYEGARENMFAKCNSPYLTKSLNDVSYKFDQHNSESVTYKKFQYLIQIKKKFGLADIKKTFVMKNELIVVNNLNKSNKIIFNFSGQVRKYKMNKILPGDFIIL